MTDIKTAILTLALVSAISSIGFFQVTQQIGSQDPVSLAGTIGQDGLVLGGSGSLISKFFENSPSPSEFISKTTNNLFSSFGAHSLDLGDHPKPDPKTKRKYIKLLLRTVIRRSKNGVDIRRYLDNSEAAKSVNLSNPCEGLSDPCPWMDLWKKQLGRTAENINDEIALIEEILKQKDCPYLRLRLALLQRDLVIVNAIIKYIEDHNKLADDDHKDLIVLLKLIVDNYLANLADVEEYLRTLLRTNIDSSSLQLKHIEGGKCPYLVLREKLQWREAVINADAFGFLYWLNHRHRRSRRDCWKLKQRIRRAIRRIARHYGGREHGKESHQRYSHSIKYPIFSMFQQQTSAQNLLDTMRSIRSRFNMDNGQTRSQ